MIAADSEVVSCELAGGAALLDLRSSTYFGLNQIGSEIWTLIREPRAVSEVCDAIVARYDVPRAQFRADLITLATQLADAGLIKITDAKAL